MEDGENVLGYARAIDATGIIGLSLLSLLLLLLSSLLLLSCIKLSTARTNKSNLLFLILV